MIRLIKQVVFRDMNGTVLKVYDVGQEIPFTARVHCYFVTAMGGIWDDEAIEI